MRFASFCAAHLVFASLLGCSGTQEQVASSTTDGEITVVPPGLERVAAGPSYFFYLKPGVFGITDPVDQEVIFVDPSGKRVGSAQLPSDFDVVRIELGEAVILRGASSAVRIGRTGDLPKSLAPIKSLISGIGMKEQEGGLLLSLVQAGRQLRVDISPPANGRVLIATYIGSDSEDRQYVYWEEEDAEDSASAWVGRFAEGRLTSSAKLDFSDFSDIPAVPVALTPDGRLWLMRTKVTSVDLLEIELSEGRSGEAETVSVGSLPSRALELGDIQAPADRDPGPELGSQPRAEFDDVFGAAAVSRGRAYLNANWKLTKENHQRSSIANMCKPASGTYWMRPIHLNASLIGTTINAVPYKWGGFDSVDKFKQKVSAPAPSLAGDICTCREARHNYCVVPQSAGVDCSGFVSRAWGLQSHHGTSRLHEVSDRLRSLSDLREGDALNRPGNHVRLFVRFEPGPEVRIRTLESAVSCGGACERVYTPVQLAKYYPIRRRQL